MIFITLSRVFLNETGICLFFNFEYRAMKNAVYWYNFRATAMIHAKALAVLTKKTNEGLIF